MITRSGLLKRLNPARIEEAIAAAEQGTSGEIRVSVATFFWGNVDKAAHRAFHRLGMHETRARNGVLVFVVPSRRRFSIVGDEGIHAKVGQAFWDAMRDAMAAAFAKGDFSEGLAEAVTTIGHELAKHFPVDTTDNPNQLTNTIDVC